MGYMQSLWRAINQISHDFDDAPDHESVETLRRALLDMPAPDRIALARELLAGTRRVVAREVERCLSITNDRRAGDYANGYNACRAAMLGDEG